MEISTVGLRQFSKVFQTVRIPGSPYQEYVYLDFENDTVSFNNDSTAVKINMIVKKEASESQENLFVDGTKFFFLVNSFDSLTISGSTFYSPRGDRFVLPLLDPNDSMEFKEQYGGMAYSLTPTPDFMRDLNVCKEFLEKEESFPAVFFLKNKMVAMNRFKLIYAPSPFDDEDLEFSLPMVIVKIISGLRPDDENSAIEFRESKTESDRNAIEFNYGNLFLKYTVAQDVEIPSGVDIFSEGFRSNFDHEDYVIVDKNDMAAPLKLISSFVNTDRGHCRIEFTSENELVVYSSTDTEIEYKVPVSTMTDKDFIGKEFWISLYGLSSAVNAINTYPDDNNLRIHFKDGASAILFSSNKFDQNELYIVQTLTLDPRG